MLVTDRYIAQYVETAQAGISGLQILLIIIIDGMTDAPSALAIKHSTSTQPRSFECRRGGRSSVSSSPSRRLWRCIWTDLARSRWVCSSDLLDAAVGSAIVRRMPGRSGDVDRAVADRFLPLYLAGVTSTLNWDDPVSLVCGLICSSLKRTRGLCWALGHFHVVWPLNRQPVPLPKICRCGRRWISLLHLQRTSQRGEKYHLRLAGYRLAEDKLTSGSSMTAAGEKLPDSRKTWG